MKLPIDLNEPMSPAPIWGELILEGIGVIALFALFLIILLGW